MGKIIVLFLCVWGVATIFYQFRATADFVGRWNFFSLIPKWTFFAPSPKTNDYLFCYQDYCEASAVPPDLGMCFFKPKRVVFKPKRDFLCMLRFVWNPNKRNTKAIADIARHILTYRATHKNRIARNALVLELYVPYLALLNFVSHCAPPSRVDCKRRFVILKTFGYYSNRPPVKIFESNFHKMEP